MHHEADIEELHRLDEEWCALAAQGSDVERVLSYWADDAAVLPPGSPAIEGKHALRGYVEGSFGLPGFSISWKTDRFVLSPSGDFAYGFGTNRVTFPAPDGVVTSHGKVVTVWRKEPDGQWKCVVDIWN